MDFRNFTEASSKDELRINTTLMWKSSLTGALEVPKSTGAGLTALVCFRGKRD